MRKNIFLFLIAVFALFISACGLDEEEEIVAGGYCSSEGLEICSDDGVELLLCQNSQWTLKKQCNISIGKRCKQNSAGIFDCFGGDVYDEEIPDSDTSDYDTDEPDSNDTSDTENENPDGDTTSEDPYENDDTDSELQTDYDNTDYQDDEVTDNDSDNDSVNDTDNDTDSDTDNDNTEPPAGQCSSNSDCSGATPYCSISTSECITNAVFITEYVEGSSYNKAIEIYNGSKTSVNLSNYTIQQANNGKDWGTTNYIYSFPDSAQLNSGAVYVICKASADSELINKCNATVSTGSTFDFSGDDGMALFEGSSIVDQIGIQGDTTPWSVAGIASATKEHTLRRKTTVIQGITDWYLSAGTTESDSQWEVLPQDTFDGLGIR